MIARPAELLLIEKVFDMIPRFCHSRPQLDAELNTASDRVQYFAFGGSDSRSCSSLFGSIQTPNAFLLGTPLTPGSIPSTGLTKASVTDRAERLMPEAERGEKGTLNKYCAGYPGNLGKLRSLSCESMEGGKGVLP